MLQHITSYEHLRHKLQDKVAVASKRLASLGDDGDLPHAANTAQRDHVVDLRLFETKPALAISHSVRG